MSITTAFTACEYSRSRRSSLRLSGIVVQLAVGWLAGKVQVKKIAKKGGEAQGSDHSRG
jgi:hypothetical protein